MAPVSRSRSAQNTCVTSATDGDVAAAATSVFVIALPTSEPMLAATAHRERSEVAAERAGVGHLHRAGRSAPVPRRPRDRAWWASAGKRWSCARRRGGRQPRRSVLRSPPRPGDPPSPPAPRLPGAGTAPAGALVAGRHRGDYRNISCICRGRPCILTITTSVALVPRRARRRTHASAREDDRDRRHPRRGLGGAHRVRPLRGLEPVHDVDHRTGGSGRAAGGGARPAGRAGDHDETDGARRRGKPASRVARPPGACTGIFDGEHEFP